MTEEISREATRPTASPQRIMDMANAFYTSCVLFASSDLGIYAYLSKDGVCPYEAIADACGLDPRAARLLLDACVAIGLLEKTNDGYSNTAESAAFLVPGSPMDLSRAIRYNRDVYGAWGGLRGFVTSGRPAERAEVHLGENDDRTRAFVMAMHGRAMGIGRAVIPQLDLSGRHRLLDIGGGSGAYSILAATANPALHCTVMDLPAVAAIATELICDAGLADRIQCVPGSYRDTPFPTGMDAVHILGVLHQESPDSIRDILKRAHDALEPGGVIHIMDMMTDATRTAPTFSALFAVNMALTTPNGWVFSDDDMRTWLSEAGFVNIKVSPLAPPMPHWLATAVRDSDGRCA